MKKLFTALVILSPLWVFAQVPVGLNYQAIAWDSQNVPMANQNITLKFEILYKNPERGNLEIEFDEEPENTTTNAAGLFTWIIGSKDTAEFKKIDWTKTPKYLRVSINDVASPTTPMLSVPYAQYVERTNLQAGAGISVSGNTITNTGDADNDAQNEIQSLMLKDNKLSLSKSAGEMNMPINNIGLTYEPFSPLQLTVTKNSSPGPKVLINVPQQGTYLLIADARITNNVDNVGFANIGYTISGSISGRVLDSFFSVSGRDVSLNNSATKVEFSVAFIRNETLSIDFSPRLTVDGSLVLTFYKLVLIRLN